MELPKQELTLEELYQIIGELEVLRRKYLQHIMKQIEEKDDTRLHPRRFEGNKDAS